VTHARTHTHTHTHKHTHPPFLVFVRRLMVLQCPHVGVCAHPHVKVAMFRCLSEELDVPTVKQVKAARNLCEKNKQKEKKKRKKEGK
jgi:hypothetical protein